jgi:predicted TIM-barrel fold metal-dependent hydrolase
VSALKYKRFLRTPEDGCPYDVVGKLLDKPEFAVENPSMGAIIKPSYSRRCRSLRIIDIHTHIYPDDIAVKATASVHKFYGFGNTVMDGTEGMLLQRGREAGIDQFVILPVAVQPSRTRHINDFILEQVAKEPRFFGFGTVHAGMENITGEVRYIREQGLRGLKMHPDYQLFSIDDPRLFPVYEMAGDQLPIVFHMGDQRYSYSHPSRLRRVLELFPRLQVIAAHFGGYTMHEEATRLLKDKDCFFDVSSSLMFMQDGVAENYIRNYGADRFVYGSDFPMWDPVTEMERFLRLKLTEREKEQIAHITAEGILNL